jgi:peptidoglycan/LPS O-acetylase OafA/YrhL
VNSWKVKKGCALLSKPGGYLPTLDGWRALAVLCVIFSHSILNWQGIGEFPPWVRLVIVGSGGKGVQLFFAISGFLITSRLIEEWHRFGRISLKRFYVRRACRILPPAMTYLTIIGLLGLAGMVSLSKSPWFAAVFFFRNFWNGDSWLTVHFWSLSVEEQFYLIWPSILALLGLYRSKYAAASIILAVITWRWFAYYHAGAAMLFPGDFWARSDICFDALLAGCLLALVLGSSDFEKWFSRHLTVWAIAGIILLILATGGHSHTPSGMTIQSLLMPFLIVATVLNPLTWLGRLLESRVFRWVGRLSYSLYIWQQVFLGQKRLDWYPLRLLALFVVAALSFYVIEKPMMRWGYRLAPPPSPGHNDLVTKL